MRGSVPFPWVASSKAVIPAKATHQPSSRSASAPVAALSRSLRSSIVPRSSACQRIRSTASRAASPRQGAWSIATRPRSGAAVEDVARRQVAVEEDDWRIVPREPSRKPAPALVQRWRNQGRKLRAAFVELRRGVEQVSDALLNRRIRESGNAAPVQGAQELGSAFQVGVSGRDDERAFRARLPRAEAPRAGRQALAPRVCEWYASRRARPPRKPRARGRGWPSARHHVRRPSGSGRQPTRSRRGSPSRTRAATALQERSARPAARRITPLSRRRSER
jgi:hypothetical protein